MAGWREMKKIFILTIVFLLIMSLCVAEAQEDYTNAPENIDEISTESSDIPLTSTGIEVVDPVKDGHRKIKPRPLPPDRFNPSAGRKDPYIQHYSRHPIAPVQKSEE